MIEYLASFSNPEAVQQIRASRKDSVKVNDEDFTRGLKRFFGREFAAGSVKKSDGKMHAATPMSVMRSIKEKENVASYKDWINLDLE